MSVFQPLFLMQRNFSFISKVKNTTFSHISKKAMQFNAS